MQTDAFNERINKESTKPNAAAANVEDNRLSWRKVLTFEIKGGLTVSGWERIRKILALFEFRRTVAAVNNTSLAIIKQPTGTESIQTTWKQTLGQQCNSERGNEQLISERVQNTAKCGFLIKPPSYMAIQPCIKLKTIR